MILNKKDMTTKNNNNDLPYRMLAPSKHHYIISSETWRVQQD